MTIERIRYFPGQALDPAELTQEQLYLREKARRHNRLLHGWGIVDGLGVKPGPADSELTIEPGYALDPRGDEIVVPEAVTVDVGKRRSTVRPLYVAIRYAERPTRPVPVGDSEEYGRIRETFAVKLLTKLPREPSVILAEVALDSDLKVANVDCHSHRRRVAVGGGPTGSGSAA